MQLNKYPSKYDSHYSTIAVMNKVASYQSKLPIVALIAQALNYDIKRIFEWVANVAAYRADKYPDQPVRTMRAMLITGRGNCVSFSTLLSAFLRYMRIPHYYVTAGMQRNNPSHVYVVTDNVILDTCYGRMDERSGVWKKVPYNTEALFPYKEKHKTK